MQICISDVKTWMTQSELKLNGDKTETLLMKSDRTHFPGDIPFTTCARNFGFMSSDHMTLNKHISAVCRSAYVKIRRISSIHQYLHVEAIKTLVCAFILSKSDYDNSLLSGCTLYLFR